MEAASYAFAHETEILRPTSTPKKKKKPTDYLVGSDNCRELCWRGHQGRLGCAQVGELEGALQGRARISSALISRCQKAAQNRGAAPTYQSTPEHRHGVRQQDDGAEDGAGVRRRGMGHPRRGLTYHLLGFEFSLTLLGATLSRKSNTQTHSTDPSIHW